VRNTLCVGIAKRSTGGGHDILNSNTAPQAITGENGAQVEEGGTSIGVGTGRGVHLNTNGSSSERGGVGRTLALPFGPDLVNHSVVKVEDRIIGRPLHSPVAVGRSQTERTETGHVTSQDDMDSGMRSLNTLNVLLEVGVVAVKRAEEVVDVGSSERSVDHRQGIDGRYTGDDQSSKEGLKGEVTTDVVGDRVSIFDVLEVAGVDLEVVGSDTPRAETVDGGVGKDGGVLKVRGIFCPVPVGVNAVVTALGPQGVLEGLQVHPVPRQEVTGPMDPNVQVHVGISPIIVIVAGRGDRWDQRIVRGGGGSEPGVVGQLGKTLDGIEPVDTLGLADAPPFPPHPGVGAGATAVAAAATAVGGAGRGEQQSGDECETQEVKEHHSEVLKVGRK